MSALEGLRRTLIAQLPEPARLVMEPNAQLPFSLKELGQLRDAEQDVIVGDAGGAAVALSRQRDFTRGRVAAHRALAQLGVGAGEAIGVAESRAPLWPDGVVGSISHCSAAVAAVVARAADVRGIGLDIEVEQELEPGAIAVVLRSDEAREYPLIQFSAKEALFKLWEPIMGSWLDFTEASVRVQPADDSETRGILDVTLHRAAPSQFRHLRGAWARGGGVAATAVWLPAPNAVGVGDRTAVANKTTVSPAGRRTQFWRGFRTR